jgi:ABC-type polysaccharide/polyol phosphate export permease
LIGFATGVIFMVACYISPAFKQIAVWIPRILWFLSGVPFRYWGLPPWTRPFFIWNPLTHVIELNRKSLSDDYFTPDANLSFALVSTVVLTTVALWIYSNNERKLLTY